MLCSCCRCLQPHAETTTRPRLQAPTTTAAPDAEPAAPEPTTAAAPQAAVLSNVLYKSDDLCEVSLDKSMSELKVGFSQAESEGAWRNAETQSMQDQEGRVSEVIVTDAQGDVAKQTTDIQDLVNQGVDIIVLAPRESDGLDAGLETARDAGIPVLFVDRWHEGDPCSDYVTFISSDFVEQGRIAGTRLADAAGGTAKIIQLEGSAGVSVADDRKAGFDEIVDQHPGMELLASQTADFSRATGQEVASQLLLSHPDVTAIYAHNDEMAIGAITALEAAGKTPGEDVLVVSIGRHPRRLRRHHCRQDAGDRRIKPTVRDHRLRHDRADDPRPLDPRPHRHRG